MNDELKDLFIRLDMILTEHTLRECAHTASHKNFDNIINGEEYYLSDGGYSRLVFGVMNERLFITSNSLNKAKENWRKPEAQELAERINKLIGDCR